MHSKNFAKRSDWNINKVAKVAGKLDFANIIGFGIV